MKQDKWDAFYLNLAKEVAEKFSKDPRRKVDAVIFRESYPLSLGYNGFVRGFPDDILFLQNRDTKNLYSEHAERNAIYNAARNNINIMGASIAVSFHPCHECAKGIIQTGLKRVIYPADSGVGLWADSIKEARFLFDKTGIEVIAL